MTPPGAPTDATPSLWFGYWMGIADGHRTDAAYYRSIAHTTLDRADAVLALSAAYVHDRLCDGALMNAIAWGSR